MDATGTANSDPSAAEVRAAAHQYVEAGRSVFPIGTNKRPAIAEWKPFQQRHATNEELRDWYGNGRRFGIAIVCGAISGGGGYGVEVIDIEGRAAYLLPLLRDEIDEHLPGLFERLPLFGTPGGGYHSSYLSPIIEAGRRLAVRLKIGADGQPVLNKHQKPETELLIETRAEGHYVVTFPSPARCHPDGKYYHPIAGDWCDLPMLTTQERGVLITICTSFNEYVEPVYVHTDTHKQANGSGTRPGDDFNARATWEDVLQPHGWQPVKRRGDGSLWRKPGARKNPYHATINYGGSDLLYVFSTSTVFEPERGYSKFAAYTLLSHGNLAKESFEAAARELGKQGYGEQGSFNMSFGSTELYNDEPQPEKRGRLIYADELDNLPPVEWLIDSEIPKRSLTLLFGLSGAGKSFVALDYALRVAQSEPVVYIAAEGVSGYASRVKAWCSHHKLPAGHLYFLPGTAETMNPKGVHDLLSEIAEVKPAMVIVDTLARCMIGGDENSAKDMGLFIEGCSRIIQATGATVLPVHHTGKTAGSGPRGSSALYGAADVIIELTNDDGRIQLRCEKSKGSAPFETRRLRLIESDDSCVLIEADRLVVALEPISEKQRELLGVLALPAFEETGARLRELVSLSEMLESTVCHSLIRLKKWGYAIQPKSKGPYFITDKGSAFLTPNDLEDIGVVLNGDESGSYSEDSNGSKDTAMSPFEAKGKPSRSHYNNSNTPLGVGVVWSEAGAVEVDEKDEGEL